MGDVPFLSYSVDLPEGFEADSDTPLTITFVNPNGPDYVVDNLPLSGRILWPGASATPPLMWPGWELLPNGTYVETTGNFAWTRQGVTVLFDVNPHFQTVVQYPPASAKCANPQNNRVAPTQSASSAVPTAVAAGEASGPTGSSGASLVGRVMVGLGVALAALALTILLGGRNRGAHQF